MHRLFVAIRPPEHIRDLLIDAMDDSPELGWVGDDNLHLTLRFIGEVERPLDRLLPDRVRVEVPGGDAEFRPHRGEAELLGQPQVELQLLRALLGRQA